MRQVRPGVWVSVESAASAARGESLPWDLAWAEGLVDWRAEELLAGRRVLRRLLSQTDPEAAEAEIAYTDSGQPYLVGHPRLGISIGHDGGTVVPGVGQGHAVGVDVQHPPYMVRDSLVRRCLGQHTGTLTALPMSQRSLEFAWVWTVQEACVKAAGTGIAGRPWKIDVPPFGTEGRWGPYEWISFRDHSDVPVSCAFVAEPGRTP